MVPVSFAPFDFAGEEWRMLDGRALFWPRENALLVADLHLEKASFYAAAGQMLPPYDSRETLERVALAIRATGARRVFTLGDNFHDAGGPTRLEPHARGMLDALTRTVDWVWITGNHDVKDGEAQAPGGTMLTELTTSGIVLRHKARTGEIRPELSGHFHPRLQITIRGRRIVRPCAVIAETARPDEVARVDAVQADAVRADAVRAEAGMGLENRAAGFARSPCAGRMILPAFGALTAGMDASDAAIREAMQPAAAIRAMLPAAGRLLHFELWRAA